MREQIYVRDPIWVRRQWKAGQGEACEERAHVDAGIQEALGRRE